MEWIDVDSTNLKRFKYSYRTGTLTVEFKGGAQYEYLDVPSSVNVGLVSCQMRGESVGKYFNKHVKKAGYEYKKL